MSFPTPYPTQSYWQKTPHRLSTYSSSPFPSTVDIVVIGSGITGVSVARSLFELSPELKVAILEARELCNGASGRNGGHCNPCILSPIMLLKIAAYLHWSHLVGTYGVEEATSMCRFMSAHPAAFQAIAEKYGLDVEARETEAVDIYDDEDLFQKAVAAALTINRYFPENVYQVQSGEQAQEKFRVSSRCVGAITYKAGQLNSYAFVTQITEILVNNGLNLQTQTPVNKIQYNEKEKKWNVETPKGTILATTVVHATNGYVDYLIPKLSAVIKPSRGHISAITAPVELITSPLERAYCFVYTTGEFDYLLQQRAQDGGNLLWGGGWNEDPEPYTCDDSTTSEIVKEYLDSQLCQVVPWGTTTGRKADFWTGIMGFSADELPLVGSVPSDLGGGVGQWYCGGYTGEGIMSDLLSHRRDVQRVALCRSSGAYDPRKGSSIIFSQFISTYS
jgi:glycine/D-amino acid oxidase-like deaminating enzyme